MNNWDNTDLENLKKAFEMATMSPDPSTQNGAVIQTAKKNILIGACNKFPPGINFTEDRLNVREIKYMYIEHAERNAIYLAAKNGFPLRGATMYACWYACADCARSIICSGITRVVGSKRMLDGSPNRWKESIATALNMLEEAEIRTDWIDGEIGGSPIRFNGVIFHP